MCKCIPNWERGSLYYNRRQSYLSRVLRARFVAREVVENSTNRTKPVSQKALKQKRLRPSANDRDYLAAYETV